MDEDVFPNGYVSFSNRALDQQEWLITRSQSCTNRMQSRRTAAGQRRFKGPEQHNAQWQGRETSPVWWGAGVRSIPDQIPINTMRSFIGRRHLCYWPIPCCTSFLTWQSSGTGVFSKTFNQNQSKMMLGYSDCNERQPAVLSSWTGYHLLSSESSHCCSYYEIIIKWWCIWPTTSY